jgi:hypothetical protein
VQRRRRRAQGLPGPRFARGAAPAAAQLCGAGASLSLGALKARARACDKARAAAGLVVLRTLRLLFGHCLLTFECLQVMDAGLQSTGQTALQWM